MINADRFLRIAYRELSLSYLFDKVSTYADWKNPFGMNRTGSGGEESSDGNNVFFQLVCAKYTSVYPENYSVEEVKKALVYYFSKTKNYGANTPKADLSYLFFFVSDQLLKSKHRNIQVDYDKLLEWDGFCNKVDANIFIGAFAALHQEIDVKNVDIVVQHDNAALTHILREGAADNHMHMKASGYSIEMCMANLFLCSFGENRDIAAWIKDSGMVYAGFAKDEKEAALNIQKIKFLRLYLMHYLNSPKGERQDKRIANAAVIRLLTAKNQTQFELSLNLLKRQGDVESRAAEKSPCDRVTVEDLLFDLEREYAVPDTERKYVYLERQFLKEMFLAEKNGELSDFVLYLFNVYLSGISQLRFFFVQDNVGMGFKKFKYREDSKGDLLDIQTTAYHIKLGNPDVYRSVFDRYYSSQIVRYVEFRIGFQNSKKLKNTLREIEESAKEVYERYRRRASNAPLPEIKYGVIIHYIKEEWAAPVTINEYRWKTIREKKEKEAKELQNYIEKGLRNNEKIVGVDAANYEMECRPEVFATIFRMHKRSVGGGRSLGITYHVGEAFECLCSGLRAIDEAVVFMDLCRGDRLGHAIALGIDVEQYKNSKRSTQSLTLLNYVDNLAWMFEIISFYRREKNDSTLLFLKDEFIKKSIRLFDGVLSTSGETVEMRNYIDSWYLRGDDPECYFDEEELRLRQERYGACEWEKEYRLNFGHPYHKRAFQNPFATKLYKIYLTDQRFYKNGNDVIQINPSEEYWQAVKLAQRCLRQKIYEKDIAIETNPSSNRKIAPVSKFIDLPFLAFNRYRLTNCPKERKGEDLSISINTDDCDIFQSDLANEYALVAAALRKENINDREIYDYIDNLRRMSIYQTFVKDE